jgi:hypothetical protein
MPRVSVHSVEMEWYSGMSKLRPRLGQKIRRIGMGVFWQFRRTVIAGLIFSAVFSGYSNKENDNSKSTGKTPSCSEELGMLDSLYVTDHPADFGQTLDGRREFYQGRDLHDDWPTAKAEFSGSHHDEKLVINGLVVMHKAEEQYMNKLGAIVTSKGGNILNVGAGLNLVDTAIESHRAQNGIKEHHVIEMNQEVYARASKWKVSQPARDNIHLHQGDWNDVLEEMHKNGTKFKGVIYDAFPLTEKDLHRDVIPFLEKLMKLQLIEEGGVITFYMDSKDGFGEKFSTWIKNLGIGKATLEKVHFEGNKDTDQYWSGDFLAPTLTDIKYPK